MIPVEIMKAVKDELKASTKGPSWPMLKPRGPSKHTQAKQEEAYDTLSVRSPSLDPPERGFDVTERILEARAEQRAANYSSPPRQAYVCPKCDVATTRPSRHLRKCRGEKYDLGDGQVAYWENNLILWW